MNSMSRLASTIATTIAAIIASLFAASASHAVPPDVPAASPSVVGLDVALLNRIEGLCLQSIDNSEIPGCVVTIVHQGHKVYQRAFGHRQLQPARLPMTTDTVFDMASITKPVATATSIMILMEQGKVRIRDEYGFLDEKFNEQGKHDITVFQILPHHAGFVPDTPIRENADKQLIWTRLYQTKLRAEPGAKFVYSDVGFQFLGKLVETVSGDSLDSFAVKHIFQPLGMNETGFLPDETLRKRAATTEQREERWMQGEVHDPRSYAMDGVAGHAGLFSTADDLARYAMMMLGQGTYGDARILSPATVKMMTTSHDVAGHQRALGWDKLSKYSSNRGENMSPAAFGHGGFTGTAMWIDPAYDLAVIFLSNRVHPNGKGSANRLAGRIATLAVSAISKRSKDGADSVTFLGRHPSGTSSVFQTLCGIDVCVRDDFQQLQGRRVGLITNHTGRSRDGKRTIDLIHESKNVELVSIFSPEHGVEGVRDDNRIGDATDDSTTLPIYSLYGKTPESRIPTPDSLANLDTLVFDIQDIGARFYTYISTMGNAMRAAAKANKRFVVLDRPNPLAATTVAGPVLDDGKQSFVGWHTIPVQHGMTVGELAKMFNAELKIGVDLQIIKAEKWRRKMPWEQTGLVWINPSPNMRSLTEAFLYPGIGLLETTNLSVGRGTDRPFEIIGAPWIDARHFSRNLNGLKISGVRFVPRQFTPTSSKFVGESCGGVDIEIVNRETLRPVRLGLAIATTLRKMYPNAWQASKMDRLLRDDIVLDGIVGGKNVDQLQSLYRSEVDAFLIRRAKYLIYD